MIDETLGIAGAEARRVSSLPAVLEGAVAVGPYSCARPGALLRVVPGIGRFLASNGCRVDYWVEAGADPRAVDALLHGGILGALIHQRGELPLHASTLIDPGRAFALAVTGHSGAGKSTTAFELIRRGWRLLTDDLTRVTMEDAVPTAWPGRSTLRLMEDACRGFGLSAGSLAPAPNWPGKFLVDVSRWASSVPLKALVILDRTAGPLDVQILRGRAALGAARKHSYRPHYVSALGCAQRHFQLLAAATAAATTIAVSGGGAVGEVADAVEAAILGQVDPRPVA